MIGGTLARGAACHLDLAELEAPRGCHVGVRRRAAIKSY
jgi:hypothetical protein